MLASREARRGRTIAEAATMPLAARVGRRQDNEIVKRASRRAAESGRQLRDVLAEDQAAMKHLPPKELAEVFDPGNWLGQSAALVDRVLADRRRRREAT